MDTGWVVPRETVCEMHVTQLLSVFAECRKQKFSCSRLAIFWIAATARNNRYGHHVKQILELPTSTDEGLKFKYSVFSFCNIGRVSVLLRSPCIIRGRTFTSR
jgi:hypothetical protein